MASPLAIPEGPPVLPRHARPPLTVNQRRREVVRHPCGFDGFMLRCHDAFGGRIISAVPPEQIPLKLYRFVPFWLFNTAL